MTLTEQSTESLVRIPGGFASNAQDAYLFDNTALLTKAGSTVGFANAVLP